MPRPQRFPAKPDEQTTRGPDPRPVNSGLFRSSLRRAIPAPRRPHLISSSGGAIAVPTRDKSPAPEQSQPARHFESAAIQNIAYYGGAHLSRERLWTHECLSADLRSDVLAWHISRSAETEEEADATFCTPENGRVEHPFSSPQTWAEREGR